MPETAQVSNRRWILKSRPEGVPAHENFELVEDLLSPADLGPGELLVRNLYTACAPDQRNWMNAHQNFHPPLALGDTIPGPAASRVVASNNSAHPVGQLLLTLGGWSHYTRIDPATAIVPLLPYPDDMRPVDALAVFGMNQLAAYFGVTKICRPKAGEVMVVSGAAGSTGSFAAQIGKIKGCHVIGIAGGRDKCEWLTGECGLDTAIDYRSEDVAARLREICADRIDIFYDNVGGEILQAGFDNMRHGGRIALCGLIAGYSGNGNLRGPDNFMRMVHGSIRMEGFSVMTWQSEFPGAVAELRSWVDSGLIKHREDVRSGLENLPDIYPDLFNGRHNGSLVVRLTDEC